MEAKRVLITDLDNTLFDWVEIWHKPFVAMLRAIQEISGLSEEILLRDFQKVFKRHKTTEYAFAIQEMELLRRKYPGQDLNAVFAPAIGAYRRSRRRVLRLYRTVEDTLKALNDRSCLVVGYTESPAFYTHYRLRKLDLDLRLDFVYSPPDHEFPDNLRRETIRTKPPDAYRLRKTIHRYTPPKELKPNPRILAQIVNEIGAAQEECVYVGDNLMKDIVMAQQAGISDVWARYGYAAERPEYELLRAVTHWSASDVQREKDLTLKRITPNWILSDCLGQIMTFFRFAAFRRRAEPSIPCRKQVI